MFEMIVEAFDIYSLANFSSFLDKYAFVILWNDINIKLVNFVILNVLNSLRIYFCLLN